MIAEARNDAARPTLSGPLPVPGGSYPFRSCRNPASSLFLDLDALGYVEEEWLVSGDADAVGAGGALLSAAVPFATRMLLRRPVGAWSGTAYLETFHPLDEDNAGWTNGWRHLVRKGHAWVGVTTATGTWSANGQPGVGGLARLRRESPERYGALHLYDPGAIGPPVTIGPDGLIDDASTNRMMMVDTQGAAIAGQVADALRTGEVLPGRASRVFAFGWSHTGSVWTRYLNGGAHKKHRFDGYLIAVAPGPSAHPDDAVVVHLLSEGELIGTLRPPMTVANDTDAPKFRGYEVPGTCHHWQVKPRKAVEHEQPPRTRHNDANWQVLVHAMLANMERWVDAGVPMPRAPRVTRTGEGVARDADGNAVGGLRSPWIDVPDGRYLARCTCSPVTGAIAAFPPEELAERYPTGRDAPLRRRAEELVIDGWLLAEDLDLVAASTPHLIEGSSAEQ